MTSHVCKIKTAVLFHGRQKRILFFFLFIYIILLIDMYISLYLKCRLNKNIHLNLSVNIICLNGISSSRVSNYSWICNCLARYFICQSIYSMYVSYCMYSIIKFNSHVRLVSRKRNMICTFLYIIYNKKKSNRLLLFYSKSIQLKGYYRNSILIDI